MATRCGASTAAPALWQAGSPFKMISLPLILVAPEIRLHPSTMNQAFTGAGPWKPKVVPHSAQAPG
ncbi:hypothetical protein KUW17_06455 [Leisingera aquaemixtae]|uniref:hypothetical protein n=1 Tax=Leisingera aquaemixtae TaxID=1396826 RepID=UPI001C96EBCD|nr:hypothetical protein [Leisingera aquaemixtae]MBY6066376.1 hypothetical protein [Leisingera aquaemixtae]